MPEENNFEPEEEPLPYRCKNCGCEISDAISEDNDRLCDNCKKKK